MELTVGAMLFDVQADDGNSIVAYVVPDSGGTTPTLRLCSGGVELLTLAANDQRQNLVEAGRHSTGQCGFIIDDKLVPGLAGYSDLELTEASSNMLVYRRRPSDAVEGRIFRLETHLLPLWKFDTGFKTRFQYWYSGVDRFGRETSEQIFCLNASSIFFSGRLLYKNFEYYLTKGVRMISVIRDPYFELAERLVLLKNIGKRAEELLGARDMMFYTPVIAALHDFDLFDETSCKRFFKKAPDETIRALSNPLVRQLTSATPDDLPNNTSVASALDALSTFEVVGLRSNPATFSVGVAEMTDIDEETLPRIDEYPRVREFGERLRAIHATEELIEKDLEVFHVIANAFKAVDA